MRTLLVGDIHGCHAELLQLIDLAGLEPGDRLIALGDVVDRGPGSWEVIDLLRSRPDTRSLRGNHERKHLLWRRGKVQASRSQRAARRDIGDERYPDALAWMAALPLYIELDAAVLVHGYALSGVPLAEQPETVLVGSLSARRTMAEAYGPNWDDHDDSLWLAHYRGDRPLVVGHRSYGRDGQPWVRSDGMAWGIDTNCCRGGRLTGLLLPGFELVSVPAQANHWAAARDRYPDLFTSQDRWWQTRWARLQQFVEAARAQDALPAAAQTSLTQLEAFLDAMDDLCDLLMEHVESECRVLERELAGEDAGARAQLFDARLAGHPLRGLMHRARRGPLMRTDIRRALKTPDKLRTVAEDLGLPT
jgi:serine/threonine protein phosphatase 1